MQFKVGDKVEYIGHSKQFFGCSGVIIRECHTLGPLCTIIRLSNGSERHILKRCLKLNQKNQQLLFDFME